MADNRKSLGKSKGSKVNFNKEFNIETIAQCTRKRIEKEMPTEKEKEKHEKMMKRLRRKYWRTASELYYPKEILHKIENAQTENELDWIMKDARNNL